MKITQRCYVTLPGGETPLPRPAWTPPPPTGDVLVITGTEYKFYHDDWALMGGEQPPANLGTAIREFCRYERAALVGINLPATISALAESWEADGDGFIFNMCPDCSIRVRQGGWAAFISFAQQEGEWGGCFVDLANMAAGLLGGNETWTLPALCTALGVPAGQTVGRPAGDQPVVQIYGCYRALLDRMAALEIDLPPDKIYSESSVGKAVLQMHGVGGQYLQTRPELLGAICAAYFGGISETRIRKEIRPGVYVDFTSLYPACAELTCMQAFAESSGYYAFNPVCHEDSPDSDYTYRARALVRRAQKMTWLPTPADFRAMATVCLVEPDGDLLPVRADWQDSGERTVGFSTVKSSFRPLWYSLADCCAAAVMTGKAPRILRAVRFYPAGGRVGKLPRHWYKKLVEGKECAETPEERFRQKVTANSCSYGIFAETNPRRAEVSHPVEIWSGGEEPLTGKSTWTETPGRFWHPLIATTVTATARLIMALTKREAEQWGLEYVFSDTDSLFLSPHPPTVWIDSVANRVGAVQKYMQELSPFAPKIPFLKTERENEGGKLFALSISSKKYALFNETTIGLRKCSFHGLGGFYPPENRRDPREWIRFYWLAVLDDLLADPLVAGNGPPSLTHIYWAHQPVALRANTRRPAGLRGLPEGTAPFSELLQTLPILPIPPKFWKPGEPAPSPAGMETYLDVMHQHWTSPEVKMAQPCGIGKLEYPEIDITEVEFIGKESHLAQEQEQHGFNPEEHLVKYEEVSE